MDDVQRLLTDNIFGKISNSDLLNEFRRLYFLRSKEFQSILNKNDLERINELLKSGEPDISTNALHAILGKYCNLKKFEEQLLLRASHWFEGLTKIESLLEVEYFLNGDRTYRFIDSDHLEITISIINLENMELGWYSLKEIPGSVKINSFCIPFGSKLELELVKQLTKVYDKEGDQRVLKIVNYLKGSDYELVAKKLGRI